MRPSTLKPLLSVIGTAVLATALPAGAADPAPAAGGATFTFRQGAGPLAVYRQEENPAKPYLEQWFTPQGIQVLRDSPSDHKHHHGLMFAVAVDGIDFWSETPANGRQKSRGVVQSAAGTNAAIVQQLDWVCPKGKLVAREARTLRVAPVAGPATLVLWQSKLEAPGPEPAKLTGSAYFGLGIRFVQSADTGGRHFNAEGKTGVAATNDVRSAWSAFSAMAGNKPFTVAIFDLPSNPRHPATWFTMDKPFAYLAATLNLHHQPLTVEPGKPLVLRYAAALWDGQVDAAAVTAVQQRLPADWSH